MIELEVYPAGLRDLNKILELDRQVGADCGPAELRPKTETEPLRV
jgi:hypothetical protein